MLGLTPNHTLTLTLGETGTETGISHPGKKETPNPDVRVADTRVKTLKNAENNRLDFNLRVNACSFSPLFSFSLFFFFSRPESRVSGLRGEEKSDGFPLPFRAGEKMK